jgi:HNH endonuclease
VVVGDAGGVLGYGLTRRVASIGQRRALAARDRGCSFPSCDRPPDWCESHHVTPWVDGGPTDVGNLTLLCGFHYREHHKRGWAARMRDGLPEWIPPGIGIDPTRTPRRNTTHHIAIRFPPPSVPPKRNGTQIADPPRDRAPAYA